MSNNLSIPIGKADPVEYAGKLADSSTLLLRSVLKDADSGLTKAEMEQVYFLVGFVNDLNKMIGREYRLLKHGVKPSNSTD